MTRHVEFAHRSKGHVDPPSRCHHERIHRGYAMTATVCQTRSGSIEMSFARLARALVACALIVGFAAQAQGWPAKPVRLVVGFPPGGLVGAVARQLQPRLQDALGQTVIVDNRGGAGGTLAAVEVARAAPDGHTLLMVFDSYASVGPGSSNHLTAEYFKAVSGTFVTHIPYRGGGPARQDLLGGQVEMMFLSTVLAQPYVNAGRLRALAQTGAQR